VCPFITYGFQVSVSHQIHRTRSASNMFPKKIRQHISWSKRWRKILSQKWKWKKKKFQKIPFWKIWFPKTTHVLICSSSHIRQRCLVKTTHMWSRPPLVLFVRSCRSRHVLSSRDDISWSNRSFHLDVKPRSFCNKCPTYVLDVLGRGRQKRCLFTSQKTTEMSFWREMSAPTK